MATPFAFWAGVVAGTFIQPDDREGILIGKPLAEKFNLQVGEKISLLVNKSEGNVDEQLFFVRGIFSANTTGYDENTVFMPLAKAQNFTGAGNHATLIFIMLQNQEQAEAVSAALHSSNFQIVSWRKINELIVQTEEFANAYMVALYLIVLGITATVVTNTLVMAVFERTREIGILAAIGMKGRRIMAQFLVEGGQQQRVAIARALATHPLIILADEPTANLDTENGKQVMEIMQQLNKETGVTFVFATHDPRVIGYASRVVTLQDGLIANDTK